MNVVLVSDTSVLVDLERGGLLASAFRLKAKFVVPDLLYDEELREANGVELQALGLAIYELDGAGITRALTFRELVSDLSMPDAAALSLADVYKAILLTGDAKLRELAENKGVECHGLLWLLDQIFADGNILLAGQLYESLLAIKSHPRCRLPRDQVELRLRQYAMASNVTGDGNR